MISPSKIVIEPIGRVPKDGSSRTFKYHGHSFKFDRYGLTKDGHAICLDAYCVLLASLPDTYVNLLQDRDELGTVQEDHIDWLEPFNELTSGENP